MAFQPGLSITRKETDILKIIGFTWLAVNSLQNNQHLLEQNKRERPDLLKLRLLLGGLCVVFSTLSVARAAWHLMS
jgi:hypothetical protein